MGEGKKMEYSQKNPNPGQGNHAIRFSNVFIKLMHLADRYCKSGLPHNDETVMTLSLAKCTQHPLQPAGGLGADEYPQLL